MSNLKAKMTAEFFGTATLVVLGCGAVVLGDFGSTQPIEALPIALAFGLAFIGLAYAIGPISGCHINPAVTIAAWIAGRTDRSDMLGYIVAQLAGGIVGAGILMAILTFQHTLVDVSVSGLGQNGWGQGYLGEYKMAAAFLVEVLATFIFLVIILAATSKSDNANLAGIAIGLTLVVLILTFIDVTGVSINPARSLGPAIFVGGKAMDQLWLFFIAPTIGSILAGLLFRNGFFDEVKSARQAD